MFKNYMVRGEVFIREVEILSSKLEGAKDD